MIQKQYLYHGHTIKATENPFLSGGWAIECDTCSVPSGIAKVLALSATYNFQRVVVDGSAIDYLGTFTAPGVPAGADTPTPETTTEET